MIPRLRPLIPIVRLQTRTLTTKPTTPTIATSASTDSTTTVAAAVALQQAPNRQNTWSGSQQPRELGMVGPRFENTDLDKQPTPYAAIDLIHRQPVRFSEKRVVSCDGGGGPMGHPRIFINVDRPEIVPCGYCGLPFAHVHHRKTLEAQESTEYPLS